MCAPDPNAGVRRAAKERHMAKEDKYASDSLKYWNKESSYLRGKQEPTPDQTVAEALEEKKEEESTDNE